MNPLETGFARTDITPYDNPKTIYHTRGQTEPDDAPIRDTLYARATAFRSGGEAAVWVTADILCVDGPLRRAVVDKLADHGVSPDHVLLSATHTHSAPMVVAFHGREPTPSEYLSFLASAMADVALAALGDAKPTTVAFGKTTVDLSVNRREIGRMAEINDIDSPTGLVDDEVSVARLEPDGGGAGLLFNYSAHPLTMSANNPQISADFPGRAVDHLEAQQNIAFAQFLQGCAGNANVKVHGDVEESTFVGRRLAEAVLEAAKGARPSSSTELRVAAETVRLPWAGIPTLDEARAEIERIRSSENASSLANVRRLEWAEEVCQVLEGGPVAPYAEVLVQALRVGDAVFVALPGEVFAEIGLAIKQRAESEHVFVVAYSNNCEIGYIPTAAAFPGGGYEVDSAPYYYGLFQLSPECEEIMIQAGLRVAQNVV